MVFKPVSLLIVRAFLLKNVLKNSTNLVEEGCALLEDASKSRLRWCVLR